MITFYLNADKPLLEDFDVTLCLGFFDGLHAGHQALIEKAKSLGKEVGVMTLSRSPRYVVNGSKEEILTSIEDRERILESLSVDYLFVVEFNKKTAAFTPFEFYELIIQQVDPKNLVCGPDYHFGKDGEGDVEALRKFCSYFKTLHVVDFLEDKGIKISSGNILLNIKDGEIVEANRLLTRPYAVIGHVVEGLHNGIKTGYKTANITLNDNYVLPRIGVYVAQVQVMNRLFYAMVNIGTHPTIDQLEAAIIEIHLLDFDEDIYGFDVKIDFLEFLREEIKFFSIEELIAQLHKDEEYIRQKYLEE